MECRKNCKTLDMKEITPCDGEDKNRLVVFRLYIMETHINCQPCVEARMDGY